VEESDCGLAAEIDLPQVQAQAFAAGRGRAAHLVLEAIDLAMALRGSVPELAHLAGQVPIWAGTADAGNQKELSLRVHRPHYVTAVLKDRAEWVKDEGLNILIPTHIARCTG
jgi:hypothetical protein